MIEVRGLVKRFGALRAVDDVSFAIRRGEIVGFLGPNGAGKSTTMRVLTGFLEADAGSVSIGGQRVGVDAEGLRARAQIGYLPERTPLDRAMRVDRYLAFVAGLRGLRGAARRDALERVVDACDLAGYTARRIRTLSKGYRQRVGLAQALVADPEVLVLDEPTSGLDPAEIVRVRRLIVELARDKTILLSTHVLGEIEEVCPRVLMIAAGRVVADGRLDELARAAGERLLVRVEGRASEASGSVGDVSREGAQVAAAGDLHDRAGDASGTAAERALEALLTSLDGVRAARRAGDRAWRLDVDDCTRVAPLVAQALAGAGRTLVELRHEHPTLENLFLERTRGLERSFERAARERVRGAAPAGATDTRPEDAR